MVNVSNISAKLKERIDDDEAALDAHAGQDSIVWTDFYSVLPQHRYLYVPTRDLWPP